MAKAEYVRRNEEVKMDLLEVDLNRAIQIEAIFKKVITLSIRD